LAGMIVPRVIMVAVSMIRAVMMVVVVLIVIVAGHSAKISQPAVPRQGGAVAAAGLPS